jgi:hypothetical protein
MVQRKGQQKGKREGPPRITGTRSHPVLDKGSSRTQSRGIPRYPSTSTDSKLFASSITSVISTLIPTS